MFAPDPPMTDGWWEVEGLTKAGAPFDPLANEAPRFVVGDEIWGVRKPPRRPLWKNFMWRTYLRNVLIDRGAEGDERLSLIRSELMRYLSQLPDIETDGDWVLGYFVLERTLPPGTAAPYPTVRLPLVTYDVAAKRAAQPVAPRQVVQWKTANEVASAGAVDSDGRKTGRWFETNGTGGSETGTYTAGVKQGPWVEVRPDRTRLAGPYRDGVREGGWTLTSANGKVIERGEWKDNEPHGEWEFFYPTGEPQKRGEYDAGVQVGVWTLWQPNGEKAAEGRFDQGKREGDWTFWHANGTIKSRGRFIEGAPHGRIRSWTPDGRPLPDQFFDHGRPVQAPAEPEQE